MPEKMCPANKREKPIVFPPVGPPAIALYREDYSPRML
jgi:hypothetical protein